MIATLRTILAKRQKALLQFTKYFFVGGVAFVADFLTLYFLTDWAGLHYLTSATIAFIIGLNVNYFLAKKTVFKTSKISNVRKEYTIVFLISLSGLLINNGVLWLLTSVFGVFYLLSKVVASIICLFYNFLVRKMFVFE